MQDEHRPQEMFSTRLVVGLVIVALGTLLLANNLGILNARSVLRFVWPLVFVAAGIVMLRRQTKTREQRWGWVFIIIGAWVFADRIGFLDINFWGVVVPALLLFAGGSMVWRALHKPDASSAGMLGNPLNVGGDEHSEFVRSFALMSAVELRPVSRPFRGADLSAVMGGIKLDLTDARMEGDSATIDVFAFWGGIEIYVPPDWTVSTRMSTLMGGFIDKRRPTSVLPTKTLIISGDIVMSGLEVKN